MDIISPRVYEECHQLCRESLTVLLIEGRNDSSVEEVDGLADDELSMGEDEQQPDREFQAKIIVLLYIPSMIGNRR